MDRLCIYHAGCPDGFGAAWAVWRAWGDGARYAPRAHEDPLDVERMAGAHVVFADIAPPLDRLPALAERAAQLVVLDHHVSAQERYGADPALANAVEAHGHRVHFDLERSGAVLAWEHFHPEEPTPVLLRYVEDQDLWRWKLPLSEEVNAALGSYPRRFEVWEELAGADPERLAAEGAPLVRARRMEVERALQSAHPVAVGPHRLEAVNAPFQRAWIGHELASRAAYGTPCGLVYRLRGSRVDVSLYSVGDFDVSRLATAEGGGGHRNAAGFSLPLSDWLARFLV